MAKEELQASGGTAISVTKQKGTVSQSTRSSSSGSTLRQSDKTKYRIISSKAADGAMSQSLTDAGYEAALYKVVGSWCKGVPYRELQETYRTEEELDGEQLQSAMLAAIKCKMKFFALGTMTADVVRDDIQTGLKMVTVRVQGEIFNLTDFPPSRVAVIPPQQYPGLGSNQNEARTNALIDAGKEAGLLITKTLQSKQIQ